jgi:serine/threonine protein kinase
MSEVLEKIKEAIGNKYEIRDIIAQGGMGQIYLGVHQSLGKKVAIKIIHQELKKDTDIRERFFREAKLSAKLNHPGIIDIYDFGSEDDFDYFIMSYIEGTNLKDKLKREGSIELNECLRLMTAVTDALSYAHDKGVVHRDIKPANIMIDKQENVILTDFGISKELGSSDNALTKTGISIGSPPYMSPEQIKGEPLDKRSDLYSLGIVFYEMITGKHPFEDKRGFEIYHAHVHEIPLRPESSVPYLPYQIGDIIMKLIEKSPDQRYEDGHQLLKEIKSFSSILSHITDENATQIASGKIKDNDATQISPGKIKDDDPTQVSPAQRPDKDSTRKSPQQNHEDDSAGSPIPDETPRISGKKWMVSAAIGLSLVLAVILVWKFYPQGEKSPQEKLQPSTTVTTVELPQEKPQPSTTLKSAEVPKPTKPSLDSIIRKITALGEKGDAEFLLRLWVDKPEFEIGDAISYHFQSDKNCYLTVFNKTSGGELIQIFPNHFNSAPLIQAKREYTVPEGFELEVTGPAGSENIIALASEEHFDLFPKKFDEQQPFLSVTEDDQNLIDLIDENINKIEKVSLIRQQITYSIVDTKR